MRLEAVKEALDCRVIVGDDRLLEEVQAACGADLMSDVLSFAAPNTLLLTGLTTVQTVRTAEIADIRAIVYVRDKLPDKEAVALAREKGIILLATRLTMFEACGRLYRCGLRGGSEVAGVRNETRGAPVP